MLVARLRLGAAGSSPAVRSAAGGGGANGLACGAAVTGGVTAAGGPAGAEALRERVGTGAWKIGAATGLSWVVFSSLKAGTSIRDRPHAVPTSSSFAIHWS
ncbi:hypothetical protein GCM10025873_03340 [Demequina sediminis]|nr:hypothetical protein GCM10025873_03340 [Demequina sediminis]